MDELSFVFGCSFYACLAEVGFLGFTPDIWWNRPYFKWISCPAMAKILLHNKNLVYYTPNQLLNRKQTYDSSKEIVENQYDKISIFSLLILCVFFFFLLLYLESQPSVPTIWTLIIVTNFQIDRPNLLFVYGVQILLYYLHPATLPFLIFASFFFFFFLLDYAIFKSFFTNSLHRTLPFLEF